MENILTKNIVTVEENNFDDPEFQNHSLQPHFTNDLRSENMDVKHSLVFQRRVLPPSNTVPFEVLRDSFFVTWKNFVSIFRCRVKIMILLIMNCDVTMLWKRKMYVVFHHKLSPFLFVFFSFLMCLCSMSSSCSKQKFLVGYLYFWLESWQEQQPFLWTTLSERFHFTNFLLWASVLWQRKFKTKKDYNSHFDSKSLIIIFLWSQWLRGGPIIFGFRLLSFCLSIFYLFSLQWSQFPSLKYSSWLHIVSFQSTIHSFFWCCSLQHQVQEFLKSEVIWMESKFHEFFVSKRCLPNSLVLFLQLLVVLLLAKKVCTSILIVCFFLCIILNECQTFLNVGTMIHSGAIIAAGISQGKSFTIPGINTKLWRVRNMKFKREIYFIFINERKELVIIFVGTAISKWPWKERFHLCWCCSRIWCCIRSSHRYFISEPTVSFDSFSLKVSLIFSILFVWFFLFCLLLCVCLGHFRWNPFHFGRSFFVLESEVDLAYVLRFHHLCLCNKCPSFRWVLSVWMCFSYFMNHCCLSIAS